MDPSLINPGHWTRDLLEAQGFNDTLIAGITISVDFIVLAQRKSLPSFGALAADLGHSGLHPGGI
ncbi:MAG: hypothetical protein EBZ34_03535 [Flavobacteriia bacterium]|nr:hypothetical protein [Flavobacteriia bacterium]